MTSVEVAMRVVRRVNLILISFLVATANADSPPECVDKLFYGKPIADAASAIGNLVPKPCPPTFAAYKKCSAKMSGCKCYLNKKQGSTYLDSMEYVAGEKGIVFAQRKMSFDRLDKYMKVSEFIGSGSGPKYLVKMDWANPQGPVYIGYWFFDGGVVRLDALCPEARIGDQKVARKFRECWANSVMVMSGSEADLPDNIKKMDGAY